MNVDWPLAITLAIVFVVTSIVRWRYFKRLAARRRNKTVTRAPPDNGHP